MTTLNYATQVSEHILTPLRRISRRHGMLVGVRCLLQLITIGLLVLLGIAVFLGYLPNLNLLLRLPIVLLTWSGIIALGYFAIRPMFNRWSVDRAALEIEHSLPQVQERISSAVELSSDKDVRFRASESLISHLISQAEEDAGNIAPQMVVRPKGLMVWSLALLPVLGIWAVALCARPLTMQAGLFRVFMPWKSALPAFLARVSVIPGDCAINQGEPITITLNISPEANSAAEATGAATLIKRFSSGQVLSQDLSQTGKLQFAATLSNVEQGFTYCIDSAAGQTPWYTVSVRARPAIAGLELSYEYPHYTGIPAKTVTAPDGAIEAVAGTKVRITVHSTQSLNERSRLTLNPGSASAQDLPLTLAEPGKIDYQATVTVGNANGTYHFVLVNSDGLQGVADETRTITAHPDQPPTIAIVSPAQASLAVRDDDTVPIRYRATDDYGVQKVVAMISVDDRPIPPFAPIWDPTDRRNVSSEYDLSVANMLKQASVDSAHRISYQFQAWDNCNPNPHSAMTVKQTLIISDHGTRSYEARLDEEDANHLIAAINEAIRQLNTSNEFINRLVQADPAQPLNAGERELAENAKNHLTKTAVDLTDAADDAMSSDMANMASQAEDIAARPITDAAQSVGKAQLDADAGKQRQQDASAARTQVADAIKQLQNLLENVKKTEQRADAARDLAQAAKDEQKAAEDMAKHPDQVDKNKAEQKKADEELQQAMNEDPALKQDQMAQSTADKLAALQQKIDQLHDQQENTSQATAQQKPPDATKLAAAQKALNAQIAQFEKQQQGNLQQAKTSPPSDAQQNQIVNDLNNNQAATAGDKMQTAANQLNDAAHKLQQAAATTQPFTQQQQDKLTADQQAQSTAKNTQTQAEQVATALNQQTQQPAAGDPAVQQAQQAAQAIQQQAKAMQPQGNEANDSRTNATQEAQKAAADATAAQTAATPADATKDLQKAAQEIRHAANDLVQAQQQSAAADQQAMQQQQAQSNQQAAAQAQALAQQQQQLLAQAQPNEQAAKDEHAQQQQIAQTIHDAQDLQQSAQTDQDDDVTQRATDAQQHLQQANAESQQAADAEHNNHPDQAAQHESKAAHALALADNDLRGHPQLPQLAQGDQPPDPHQAMDDQQQPQPGDPGQQDPHRAQANDPNGQPQHNDMAQQQGQGQQDPSQQNAHDQNAQAQNNPQGQHNAQGQEQSQGQHQAQGQQGQHGQQQGNPEQSADAAHHDAASAADEAQHAQGQADQANNANAQQAAQEAANELAQASEKMEQSIPGNSQSNAAGQPHMGGKPGKSGSASSGHFNKPEPASVQAIGISSNDWAKLPPLVQQDLLNASQQNSLPAYRESIKNYFEKIARLHDSDSRQQPQ